MGFRHAQRGAPRDSARNWPLIELGEHNRQGMGGLPRKFAHRTTPTPDLFIALVGPVGTDLETVVEILSEKLAAVDYQVEEIRLSHLLRTGKWKKKLDAVDGSGFEGRRIKAYQKAGDQLRKDCADGAALAYLAVQKLFTVRRELPYRPHRTGVAFVFNSLKHPKEIDELRRLYGDSLLVISVYCPISLRRRYLAQKIQKSRGSTNPEIEEQVESILLDDEHTTDRRKLSQNVRDTFPLADVFVTMQPRIDLESQIERTIRLWFGSPFLTPTKDEQGMFFATAAAYRSADLSRQVGAAIINDAGEVLALGCNEVPKPQGGAYWHGDPRDYRDFNWGADENQRTKREIVRELATRLEGSLKDALSPDEAVRKWMDGDDALLKGTRLAALIEFGRVVHAEMHALMEAARRGISLDQATLLCTTFPCHMCARHVLAAGVRRVIYIEPYPKSMTPELYGRAVSIDGEDGDPDSVSFSAFVGVAPRSYLRFFEAGLRKDKFGYPRSWSPMGSLPRISNPFMRDIELTALNWVAMHANIIGISED